MAEGHLNRDRILHTLNKGWPGYTIKPCPLCVGHFVWGNIMLHITFQANAERMLRSDLRTQFSQIQVVLRKYATVLVRRKKISKS